MGAWCMQLCHLHCHTPANHTQEINHKTLSDWLDPEDVISRNRTRDILNGTPHLFVPPWWTNIIWSTYSMYIYVWHRLTISDKYFFIIYHCMHDKILSLLPSGNTYYCCRSIRVELNWRHKHKNMQWEKKGCYYI